MIGNWEEFLFIYIGQSNQSAFHSLDSLDDSAIIWRQRFLIDNFRRYQALAQICIYQIDHNPGYVLPPGGISGKLFNGGYQAYLDKGFYMPIEVREGRTDRTYEDYNLVNPVLEKENFYETVKEWIDKYKPRRVVFASDYLLEPKFDPGYLLPSYRWVLSVGDYGYDDDYKIIPRCSHYGFREKLLQLKSEYKDITWHAFPNGADCFGSLSAFLYAVRNNYTNGIGAPLIKLKFDDLPVYNV